MSGLKVKICGHHRDEDVEAIVPFLTAIDYVGFIFTPKSKRVVSADQVAVWLGKYPPLREKAVAVFLDQPEEEILETTALTGIARIQLHGKESPDYCRRLREKRRFEIWKVIAIDRKQRHRLPAAADAISKDLPITNSDQSSLGSYLNVVDSILLDTKVKGRSGGTGVTFDWSVIPEIRHIMDQAERGIDRHIRGSGNASGEAPLSLMIAGGITPDNVAELVRDFPIDGIDVSSGVETDFGKDGEKIKALLKGVHQHAQF